MEAQMTSQELFKLRLKQALASAPGKGTPKTKRITGRLGVLQLTAMSVSTSSKRGAANWSQAPFPRTMCLITSSPEALVSST